MTEQRWVRVDEIYLRLSVIVLKVIVESVYKPANVSRFNAYCDSGDIVYMELKELLMTSSEKLAWCVKASQSRRRPSQIKGNQPVRRACTGAILDLYT